MIILSTRSKNKIYDSELFISIKNLTPKATRKFVLTNEFVPHYLKQIYFSHFFSKNSVYSIKYIYVLTEL